MCCKLQILCQSGMSNAVPGDPRPRHGKAGHTLSVPCRARLLRLGALGTSAKRVAPGAVNERWRSRPLTPTFAVSFSRKRSLGDFLRMMSGYTEKTANEKKSHKALGLNYQATCAISSVFLSFSSQVTVSSLISFSDSSSFSFSSGAFIALGRKPETADSLIFPTIIYKTIPYCPL